MDHWSVQQHAFTVKAFYLNGYSFVVAWRVFRTHFGINKKGSVPSTHAIKL